MKLENLYRLYAAQKQKTLKDNLISVEELGQRLRTLCPGEMLTLSIMEGGGENAGETDINVSVP